MALFERGIDLVPDFIANPGGIIAAFVEMTAGAGVDKVRLAKETTEQKISENVARMCQVVQAIGVEPSKAGMYLALKAVFKE
jgi:glutamate dehydrogenase (NAD(P)+)